MTRPRDIADGINRIDTSAADATAITIDANENVGIGEDVPLKELSVVGTVRVQSANGDTQGLNISSDANGDAFIDAGYSVSDLKFGINGSERMRIDSSGNVGIGDSFDVIAATGLLHLRVGSGAGSPDIILERDDSSVANNNQIGSLQFFAGEDGSEEKVAAVRAIASEAFSSSSSATRLIFETTPSGSTSASQRMNIREDGGVGIGTDGASTVRLFVIEGSNRYGVYNYATNSAYTNDLYLGQCGRSASSLYNLLTLYAVADREFQFRGDGNAFADGTFSGGGADYAEMFEWEDGNSSNEDRRGFSVVLTNGNKIRKATSDDAAADIIGIVSANPTVLGDSAWNMWDEKYNKDDFGNYILETYTVTEWTEPAVFEDVEIEAVLDEEGNEIEPARTKQRKVSDEVEHSYETDKIPSDLTVPSDAVVSSVDADGNALERRQLNSSYDDTQTYTPREERQEWDAVGMMGKLRMRTGQPTGDRWIKMRDITSDIEEWLVR